MFSRQPFRTTQMGTRKHVRDNDLQATLRGRIDNLGAHEKQQRKYAAEARKEKAEKDAKTAAYMEEWTRLNDKEQKRFVDARDKYEKDMETYMQKKEEADYYGTNPNSRKYPKPPKKPAEFKDPVVPNAKERFGVSGGRRTRSRKTRSTRRR